MATQLLADAADAADAAWSAAARRPRRSDLQVFWHEVTGHSPPYYVPLQPGRAGDLPGYKLIVFGVPGDEALRSMLDALRGILSDADVSRPDLVEGVRRSPCGEPQALLTWRSSADCARAKAALEVRAEISRAMWWIPLIYNPWAADERFAGTTQL